ncbi:hypothetical protein ACGRVM_05590 [Roseovarius aquimarinus]|uniref:Uncharacterized protein n=2 Tax=Roseovarius aquimarinus TaxID=1229156 RepID=A0ABW7I5R2_9RHOB
MKTQTFVPTPGTDPQRLAVQLVLCDSNGRPRRERLWGLLRLLKRDMTPPAF